MSTRSVASPDGSPARRTDFRARLRRGERILTSFAMELPAPALADVYAQAGFDALIIDTEHSAFGRQEVSNLVTACRAAGIASIVRVGGDGAEAVTAIADLWPSAVMFPRVVSADHARALVRASKYRPEGERGAAPMVRYARLGENRFDALNDALGVIVQIEGADGLRAAPEIAGLAGVDALFVGTYDLSHALGVPGQLDHALVVDACRDLRASIPPRTALGVFVLDPATAGGWLRLGVSLVACGTDAQLLLAGCRNAAMSVNGATQEAQR